MGIFIPSRQKSGELTLYLRRVIISIQQRNQSFDLKSKHSLHITKGNAALNFPYSSLSFHQSIFSLLRLCQSYQRGIPWFLGQFSLYKTSYLRPIFTIGIKILGLARGEFVTKGAMDIDSNEENASHGSGKAPMLQAPLSGNPITKIAKTPFAGPYESLYTLTPPALSNAVMKCLKHVNCSYLSTEGRPPTLTQLKQHAHSLTVLIKHLTVSTKEGLVDNDNYLPLQDAFGANDSKDNVLHSFYQNESFDWLNNLSKPYENDDHHHNLELTSVLNRLDDFTDEEARDICPMHAAADDNPPTGHSLPYATHISLIQHANEILELLDHEYSAKGGLLSILPTKDQKKDREEAEATLLGQLILYLQRLVQRLHDLERLYANSIDMLTGEAVIPHQTLSKLGPKGRQSREVVFPQDRFVLVNAGDDVWQFLQSEFDRKESADVKLDKHNRALGITGEAIWNAEAGKDAAKGITTLDVTTRYYRLRNDVLKTVFVIPAHQEHPGVKVTREMEREPTVVSVVKPVWPERASTWEMRNRENMARLKQLERDHALLSHQEEILTQDRTLLTAERERNIGMIKKLEQEIKDMKIDLETDPNKYKLEKVMSQATKAQEAENERMAAKTKLDALYEEQKKLADKQKRANDLAEADIQHRLAKAKRDEAQAEKLKKEYMERNADLVFTAHELAPKLKAVWVKQMTETQVLLDVLGNNKVQDILTGVKLPDGPNVEEARRKVQKAIEDAIKFHGHGLDHIVPEDEEMEEATW